VITLNEIARFADVPVEIEVELDRRVLTIRELLELEAGSVIGMTRSAGENIDLYVGGKLVGYGEIMLIESNIGVRITDFRIED
jgi:flagellar motor switch protein FliN/FliY